MNLFPQPKNVIVTAPKPELKQKSRVGLANCGHASLAHCGHTPLAHCGHTP